MQIWYEIDEYKGLITPLKVEKKGPSMFTLVGGYRQQYHRDRHFKTFEAAAAKLKEKAEADLEHYRQWSARAERTLWSLTHGNYASKPAQYAALEDEAAGITVGSDAHLARAVATGD